VNGRALRSLKKKGKLIFQRKKGTNLVFGDRARFSADRRVHKCNRPILIMQVFAIFIF